MVLTLLIAAALLAVILAFISLEGDPVNAITSRSVAAVIIICILSATAIQITEILA